MDLRPEAEAESESESESESGPDRLLTSNLPSSSASDATRCWSSFLPDTLSSVCLVLQYFCCSFFTTDEFWSGFSRSRSSWEEPLQTDSS